MKITIEFNCDSFGPDNEFRDVEIRRILREAATTVVAVSMIQNVARVPILDRNGNSIGSIKVTK
jgi:hypothetical protein